MEELYYIKIDSKIINDSAQILLNQHSDAFIYTSKNEFYWQPVVTIIINSYIFFYISKNFILINYIFSINFFIILKN